MNLPDSFNGKLNSLPFAQDVKWGYVGAEDNKYPVIGGIPVLIENCHDYLAESYALYGRHLAEQRNLLKEFEYSFKNSPLRLGILENLQRAIRHNIQVMEPMANCLEDHFSKEQLLNVFNSYSQSSFDYLMGFRYLKRDWSGLPESEEQVLAIVTRIREALKHNKECESVLLLGAGLGRVACELCDLFSRVLAVDRSWSMSYLFQKVLREDIHFYEINYSNNTRGIHSAQLLKAGLSCSRMEHSKIELIKERLTYFVSDVRRIPLADNSVSCVISAYFTDVVALDSYIMEVHRVLKKDGLFIHLGPLGYNFRAVEKMLTAEEVRAYFFKLGYMHIEDGSFESIHLDSHKSLYKSIMTNWLFVTQKKTESLTDQKNKLSGDSILDLIVSINYQIEGSTNASGRQEKFTIMSGNGKVYDGMDSVLDFISLIDGIKTLSMIVEELKKAYDLDEQGIVNIYALAKDFISDGVLHIRGQ